MTALGLAITVGSIALSVAIVLRLYGLRWARVLTWAALLAVVGGVGRMLMEPVSSGLPDGIRPWIESVPVALIVVLVGVIGRRHRSADDPKK